jgi:signal peptidase I
VKRIIGEPGEHLRVVDGKLFINDREETVRSAFGPIAIIAPYSQSLQTDLVIPRGQYFVIGDNAINSYDSRHFGPIPAENIKGRVVFRYRPIDRMGVLR